MAIISLITDDKEHTYFQVQIVNKSSIAFKYGICITISFIQI